MRTLVLTNMYPPHHLGGYEQSCRDCVDRWRAHGIGASVLTTDMRLSGVADPPGEDVRRQLRFYWKDHEILSPPPVERLRIERHNHRVLSEALDEVRPDVVSVWHMGAMSQSLLTAIARRAIPMVFVVCDDWMIYGPNVDAWISTFRNRPLLRTSVGAVTRIPTTVDLSGTATAFCFVSDFTRRRAYAAELWPRGRSTVVYSGIDLGDFPIESPDTASWTWRLLFAGRVEERKGVHVAVEALSMLPSEARLDIVGPASEAYRTHLEAIVAERGLAGRVAFAQEPRASLGRRYRDADVVVHPVVWDEPFGLVPVEAMACGTPVVATATGGAAEYLVHDANAVVVPPNDPKALAEGVRRLATDAELRARLVANGQSLAHELNVDRLAETLEAWHVAAAKRFRDGGGPDRPSLRS